MNFGPARFLRQMPSPVGVTPGGIATVELPIGWTYHKLFLYHSANITLAEMTGLRLKVNGKIIRTYASGTELNSINKVLGLRDDSSDEACLLLDFEREMRTAQNVALTALGTGFGRINTPEGVREFGGAGDKNRATAVTLEIDIASGATGAAVADLTVFAEVSQPRPLGVILQNERYTVTAGAAGVVQWRDLSGKDKGLLNNVAILGSTATHLKVSKNGVDLMPTLPVATVKQVQAAYGLATVANYLLWNPVMSGFGNQEIPTADGADWNFEITVSGAGTLTIIPEYLAPLVKA